MIIIFHKDYRVVQIFDENHQSILEEFANRFLSKALIEVSTLFSEDYIVWCEISLKDDLNFDEFETVFHHNRVLASFNPFKRSYLPREIGYIERSYYLKINKEVLFPTWMMSSWVGGIHASVVLNLKDELQQENNFDYFINSLAKRTMVEGMFCYSAPCLLRKKIELTTELKSTSTTELFKFVKQHYKWVWVYFLALSFLIYQRKLVFLPLIKSLLYKQLRTDFSLDKVTIQSSRKVVEKRDIDVIIPTIGRKKYLYDVLKDLAKQVVLPKNVIIVEQNEDVNSISELDYLTKEDWPFKIKHSFINQLGVCHARNLALSLVESEWTFLGDDDNRFNSNLLEGLFNEIEKTGTQVGTTVYLQSNEIQTYFKTAQTSIFGAGNSMIKSSLLKQVCFDNRYEFNYGEDTDYGMQLRQIGQDVIYFSNIKIAHLKAPIGGYRTKFKQLWEMDEVQPKPSPTIYLLNNNYYTNCQFMGYKLVLMLRNYKVSKFEMPWVYISSFNKKWKRSEYWSTQLTKTKNA